MNYTKYFYIFALVSTLALIYFLVYSDLSESKDRKAQIEATLKLEATFAKLSAESRESTKTFKALLEMLTSLEEGSGAEVKEPHID